MLAALLSTLILPFLGSRGLWEPDEGRYSAAALEMLRSGDWLHPALHHEQPLYAKPPLTYWALAASMRLLGENEWALRLPNALAYIATGLLVYALGIRLVPERPWLPTVVWATSLLPFAAAHVITTDTLLTLWETLGMLGFVAAWGAEEPVRRKALVVLWVGFGLAFLTKGAPGLLPLLAILMFSVWVEGHRGPRRLLSGPGIALFLVLAFGWYTAVVATEPGLLRYLLHNELLDRIATGRHGRHPQWYGAFEVYLPALLLGSLPWTWVLMRGAARFLGRLRRGRPAGLFREHPQAGLLLLWFLVPMGVFILTRSRLTLYVLPLQVPLSLLAARAVLPRFEPRARRVHALVAAWAVLLIAVAGWAASLPHERDARALAAAIASQVREPFEEVVFVETHAWSGLALYTGVEVERVVLESDPLLPDIYKPLETLEAELEDPAETGVRLFVVPEHHAVDLELAMGAGDALCHRRGGFHGLRFYTVERVAGS